MGCFVTKCGETFQRPCDLIDHMAIAKGHDAINLTYIKHICQVYENKINTTNRRREEEKRRKEVSENELASLRVKMENDQKLFEEKLEKIKDLKIAEEKLKEDIRYEKRKYEKMKKGTAEVKKN